MRATWAVSLVLVILGMLFALETVVIVRTEPEVSFAGSSTLLLVFEVATGLTLVGAGAVALGRGRTRGCGLLVAAAGAVWLTREWASPAAGAPLVFTMGLVLAGVAPVLLAHAAYRFPGMPRTGSFAIPIGYATVAGWQWVAPALFLDPQGAGCSECPANVLLLAARGSWSENLARSGSWVAAGWAAFAAADLLQAGWTASPAWRRVASPFATAVSAVLVLTAWITVRAALGWTPEVLVDDRLWLLDGALLSVAGGALLYERVHAHQMKVSLARLAVDLSNDGSASRLSSTLARLLGDSSLTLLYPLPDQTLVDAQGRSTDLPPHAEATVLSRGGQPIAYLLHRPGALDDAVMDEIGAAATMSIDHERQQAMAWAHLAALRASRARIVATRDAERYRLERDLHDGAQQRLVTLGLLLRLAQTEPSLDRNESSMLDACAAEVASAVAELRILAHGIYPAALADEGIAAALQVLAETAPLNLDRLELVKGRYPSVVESTAYFALAQLVRHCVHDSARLAATQTDTGLRFEMDVDALTDETIDDLKDRIGAVDGRLTLDGRDNGGATVVMEIPCE